MKSSLRYFMQPRLLVVATLLLSTRPDAASPLAKGAVVQWESASLQAIREAKHR